MNNAIITIVIPIYNRLEVTKQGLAVINKSIAHYYALYPNGYTFKIIIVDDGSTDGSSEWIAANYPEISILKGNGSLWWTGAINLGISHVLENAENVKGILLQNDDIMIDENWIESYVNAIDANPESLIGCATTTLDKKDVIDYGGRALHPWFAGVKMHNKNARRADFPKGYVSPSFDLYGRGLYIPIAVFSKTGLFDSKRFKHRGDMDLPLRAKAAGFKLLVSYDAIVYQLPEHAFGLDTKKKLSLKDAYKMATDFRSTFSINLVYHYSVIATRNKLQFATFFTFYALFHLKAIAGKYIKQFV